MRRELLDKVSSIPPHDIMCQGEDQSVATKKSVLNPQYPKVM